MPKNEVVCVWLNGKLLLPEKAPAPSYELLVDGKPTVIKVGP